ncbi:MAG: 5'-methylthioadenosine nucleosidase [Rhodobacteraceae bacterium]|nr:MAG: 5'-methylthioadenosine nucleosidase [Paracoccaceae bacterium]
MLLHKRQEVLLIIALKEELPRNLLPECNIEYCGVGKINATYKALEIISKYEPKLIINFGTAGSLRKNLFGLHEVSHFFQRDMDATALGFKIGVTPFEERSVIDFGRTGLSCSSGDNFVSSPPELKTDLVDMEAYAIAKVCVLKNVQFMCFKYVSDNADESASKNWKANASLGATAFKDMIKNLDLQTMLSLREKEQYEN